MRILEMVDLISTDEKMSPFASRYGTFKRKAYTLLRKTMNTEGGHNVIKAIVGRAGIEPARLTYAKNEYHWGLLAIDPHEDVLDSKKISLFARQLTYADLHQVPEHHLIGFLYQSGSTRLISEKLKIGSYEPWWLGPHKRR